MSNPVAALLQENGISFTVSGKDYVIKCLNPEHDDRNPSLRVDMVSGLAHCFACGWKRNIFRHFGKLVQRQTSIKTAKLKEKIQELMTQSVDIAHVKDPIPWTKTFREVSAQTFRHFEAFYTLDNTQGMQDRIIFPIKNISGKIVSYIGRHVGQGDPRYKHFPSGAPSIPFPLLHNSKNVVLVEGIFDMLNLYDKGLTNVVCCFGTDTLKNNAKEKLLPLKAQGINKIFLMFDGDEAGRSAAKEVKLILENIEYTVEIIELPDDTDPGELSREDIQSIKEYVNA